MSTFVSTPTYTHTVTHLTDKLLTSISNIIRDSGLDMGRFCRTRETLEEGIKAWLDSGHLEYVVLEIYEPGTEKLIKLWKFEVFTDGTGEQGFWFDGADIRYHLQKAGAVPSRCDYNVKVQNKFGEPAVAGWSSCQFRDASALRQYSLGTTISVGNSGARTSYYR